MGVKTPYISSAVSLAGMPLPGTGLPLPRGKLGLKEVFGQRPLPMGEAALAA
jgi:hypothetical protein